MARRAKVEKKQEPITEKKKIKAASRPKAVKKTAPAVQPKVEAKERVEYKYKERIFDEEPRGRIISLNDHAAERKKKMIMWTGVTFFMVLIGGFWLFNFKNVFKNQVADSDAERVDMEQITENLSKTMEEVSKSLDKLKEGASATGAVETSSSVLPPAITASTSATGTDNGSVEIEQLKKRIEQLEKNK